jgi:protein-S-isoprenylcysteine O-methyltransferase Ste14
MQVQEGSNMHERLFQSLAFASLVGLALVWTANLLKVGFSRDVFYSHREGRAFALISRALIIAAIGGVVAYTRSSHSMAWARLTLPAWLRILGLPLAAGGIALFSWVLVALGRQFSTSLVIRSGHTLVASGPYRWVRHPMYTALCLFFLGQFLLCANWFVGVTAGTAFLGVMLVRTPREERMLLERFGQEYRTYMEGTGRFIPKVGRHGM